MKGLRIHRVVLWSGLLFGLFPAWSLAADKAQGQVSVQWLGHAAFKITSVSGKVILIDPFISKNPKLPAEQKDLARLGKVDLILITHAHGDHVGDGPALAKQHNAPLYGPAGLNDTLVALGELPNQQTRYCIPAWFCPDIHTVPRPCPSPCFATPNSRFPSPIQ